MAKSMADKSCQSQPWWKFVADNSGMSRALTLCVLIIAAAMSARAEQAAGSAAAPNTAKRTGDYRMDVATIQGPAGVAGLRVTINDPSNGGVVRKFEVVDEKPFHLFIVGRDLKFFRHLFPVVHADGRLEAREPLPPGEYLVVADFLPAGGARQFLRRAVTLGGNSRGDSRGDSRAQQTAGPPAPGSPGRAFDIVTNVRIQPLPFTLTAGTQTAFHVMLSRTEDGRPLVNLEPYLGLGGYLLAVKNDLSEVVAAGASTDGLPVSLLTFDMTYPTPGPYVVWVEFHRFGESLAARLEVTAR
jgi:hypothetical protein